MSPETQASVYHSVCELERLFQLAVKLVGVVSESVPLSSPSHDGSFLVSCCRVRPLAR